MNAHQLCEEISQTISSARQQGAELGLVDDLRGKMSSGVAQILHRGVQEGDLGPTKQHLPETPHKIGMIIFCDIPFDVIPEDGLWFTVTVPSADHGFTLF